MGIFSKSGSIGLYIDKFGFCRGVKLSSQNSIDFEYSVQLSLLDSELEADAKLLNNLISKFRPKDDQPILVSKHKLGSSTDLVMPNLSVSDLEKALYFEVPKLTPLSEDDYKWGYRIIENRGDQGLLLRISIIRRSDWEHLVNLVSRISGGIEMVIPIEFALDPVLTDHSYINTEGKISFTKKANGLREVVFGPTKTYREAINDLPVVVADTISGSCYDAAFYKAVVLAEYGLSISIKKDVTSWISLPVGAYTHHKRSLRVINYLVSTVILSIWIYVGYLHYQVKDEELAVYKKHAELLRKEVNAVKVTKTNDALVKKVQTEMATALRNRPGLANIIAEATVCLSDEYWCEKLRWDGERLVLSLICDKAGLSVGSCFDDSKIFTIDAIRSQARTPSGENITMELLVNEVLDEVPEEEATK